MITEEQLIQAKELTTLANDTLTVVFDTVENLILDKKHNLAKSYIQALAIDMIGKMLTFPRTNMQDDLIYISKWIKHRYGLNLKMTVEHPEDKK